MSEHLPQRPVTRRRRLFQSVKVKNKSWRQSIQSLSVAPPPEQGSSDKQKGFLSMSPAKSTLGSHKGRKPHSETYNILGKSLPSTWGDGLRQLIPPLLSAGEHGLGADSDEAPGDALMSQIRNIHSESETIAELGESLELTDFSTLSSDLANINSALVPIKRLRLSNEEFIQVATLLNLLNSLQKNYIKHSDVYKPSDSLSQAGPTLFSRKAYISSISQLIRCVGLFSSKNTDFLGYVLSEDTIQVIVFLLNKSRHLEITNQCVSCLGVLCMKRKVYLKASDGGKPEGVLEKAKKYFFELGQMRRPDNIENEEGNKNDGKVDGVTKNQANVTVVEGRKKFFDANGDVIIGQKILSLFMAKDEKHILEVDPIARNDLLQETNQSFIFLLCSFCLDLSPVKASEREINFISYLLDPLLLCADFYEQSSIEWKRIISQALSTAVSSVVSIKSEPIIFFEDSLYSSPIFLLSMRECLTQDLQISSNFLRVLQCLIQIKKNLVLADVLAVVKRFKDVICFSSTVENDTKYIKLFKARRDLCLAGMIQVFVVYQKLQIQDAKAFNAFSRDLFVGSPDQKYALLNEIRDIALYEVAGSKSRKNCIIIFKELVHLLRRSRSLILTLLRQGQVLNVFVNYLNDEIVATSEDEAVHECGFALRKLQSICRDLKISYLVVLDHLPGQIGNAINPELSGKVMQQMNLVSFFIAHSRVVCKIPGPNKGKEITVEQFLTNFKDFAAHNRSGFNSSFWPDL